jgi:hypothetical protein
VNAFFFFFFFFRLSYFSFSSDRLPSPPTGNPPATPLYDSLTTNIPHPVMAYGSFPFPAETPLYPSAMVVLSYLNAYADQFDLRRFIRLNTGVEAMFWDAEQHSWNVTLSTGDCIDFDAVIVANGHYSRPRYPRTLGLFRWIEAGKAMHSIYYRNPDQLADHDKIIVVGGGPSARDVCVDLRATGKLVLQSTRSQDGNGLPETPNYRKVPVIAEYLDNGSIIFEDGSSEPDVGFVVLATGYEVSFPFLSKPQMVCGLPEMPPPFPTRLYNSSYHVFPLVKHMFPLQSAFPCHSIAFTGLLMRVAPFPIFEDQARAIVRVLADPFSFDVAAESNELVKRAKRLEEQGADTALALAKEWFMCAPMEGFAYREQLRQFADPSDIWKTPEWTIWMWERKAILRAAWEKVESRGEATRWLKGVGVNGVDDWVKLCRRLLESNED